MSDAVLLLLFENVLLLCSESVNLGRKILVTIKEGVIGARQVRISQKVCLIDSHLVGAENLVDLVDIFFRTLESSILYVHLELHETVGIFSQIVLVELP